jgi:hypothetical protein
MASHPEKVFLFVRSFNSAYAIAGFICFCICIAWSGGRFEYGAVPCTEYDGDSANLCLVDNGEYASMRFTTPFFKIEPMEANPRQGLDENLVVEQFEQLYITPWKENQVDVANTDDALKTSSHVASTCDTTFALDALSEKACELYRIPDMYMRQIGAGDSFTVAGGVNTYYLMMVSVIISVTFGIAGTPNGLSDHYSKNVLAYMLRAVSLLWFIASMIVLQRTAHAQAHYGFTVSNGTVAISYILVVYANLVIFMWEVRAAKEEQVPSADTSSAPRGELVYAEPAGSGLKSLMRIGGRPYSKLGASAENEGGESVPAGTIVGTVASTLNALANRVGSFDPIYQEVALTVPLIMTAFSCILSNGAMGYEVQAIFIRGFLIFSCAAILDRVRNVMQLENKVLNQRTSKVSSHGWSISMASASSGVSLLLVYFYFTWVYDSLHSASKTLPEWDLREGAELWPLVHALWSIVAALSFLGVPLLLHGMLTLVAFEEDIRSWIEAVSLLFSTSGMLMLKIVVLVYITDPGVFYGSVEPRDVLLNM